MESDIVGSHDLPELKISQSFRLLKSWISGRIKGYKIGSEWYRISFEALSITTFPRIGVLSIDHNQCQS